MVVRVFVVIMIANTGNDATVWEWWYGSSIEHISSRVTAGNYRVMTFTPDPVFGWAAILVENKGLGWWWWSVMPVYTNEELDSYEKTKKAT